MKQEFNTPSQLLILLTGYGGLIPSKANLSIELFHFKDIMEEMAREVIRKVIVCQDCGGHAWKVPSARFCDICSEERDMEHRQDYRARLENKRKK